MMSTRSMTFSLALALIPLAALPAAADSFDVEARAQHERIESGIRNGSLTYREAATLREEQHRITRMIVRAREDGRVDPYERREIERAQVQASAHIYREKHDAEVAPRRYGWWQRTGYDGRSRWW